MKAALALWMGACVLSAQAPSPLPATPERIARAKKSFEDWRGPWLESQKDDFGQLGRYRAANAALPPPARGEQRVIFFGDSITDMWKLEASFPGKPYLNRGIGGQTTRQMLVRFRSDVINLRPKAVVILAGTNDLSGNTGPTSLEEIEGNYATMAELAKLHGIRVVFSSVLPVHGYTERAFELYLDRPMDKIRELNRWLKAYCKAHHGIYLDYFSAMLDAQGYLRPELALDGLHPNGEGYKIMAPLAEGAIAKALR